MMLLHVLTVIAIYESHKNATDHEKEISGNCTNEEVDKHLEETNSLDSDLGLDEGAFLGFHEFDCSDTSDFASRYASNRTEQSWGKTLLRSITSPWCAVAIAVSGTMAIMMVKELIQK